MTWAILHMYDYLTKGEKNEITERGALCSSGNFFYG